MTKKVEIGKQEQLYVELMLNSIPIVIAIYIEMLICLNCSLSPSLPHDF